MPRFCAVCKAILGRAAVKPNAAAPINIAFLHLSIGRKPKKKVEDYSNKKIFFHDYELLVYPQDNDFM